MQKIKSDQLPMAENGPVIRIGLDALAKLVVESADNIDDQVNEVLFYSILIVALKGWSTYRIRLRFGPHAQELKAPAAMMLGDLNQTRWFQPKDCLRAISPGLSGSRRHLPFGGRLPDCVGLHYPSDVFGRSRARHQHGNADPEAAWRAEAGRTGRYWISPLY